MFVHVEGVDGVWLNLIFRKICEGSLPPFEKVGQFLSISEEKKGSINKFDCHTHLRVTLGSHSA